MKMLLILLLLAVVSVQSQIGKTSQYFIPCRWGREEEMCGEGFKSPVHSHDTDINHDSSFISLTETQKKIPYFHAKVRFGYPIGDL